MIFEKLSSKEVALVKEIKTEYLHGRYEYYGTPNFDAPPDAVVIFSKAVESATEYDLHYVYISEELRGCGLLKKLIEALCGLLSDRGAKRLYCRACVPLEAAEDNINFMDYMGFVPVNVTTMLLKYQRENGELLRLAEGEGEYEEVLLELGAPDEEQLVQDYMIKL